MNLIHNLIEPSLYSLYSCSKPVMKYMNILIVKLSAIGDIVHALPVAKDLKE